MRDADLSFPQRLRTMQIIAGAMIAGAVTFLVIALYLVQTKGAMSGDRAADAPPVLTWVAVAFLLMTGTTSFIVPASIERSAISRLACSPPDGHVQPPPGTPPGGPLDDSGFLMATYQTAMIIGIALLNGTSFLASIAYLMEGQPLALAVNVVSIVGEMSRFPTEGRVTGWLNERRRAVADIRARLGTRPKA